MVEYTETTAPNEPASTRPSPQPQPQSSEVKSVEHPAVDLIHKKKPRRTPTPRFTPQQVKHYAIAGFVLSLLAQTVLLPPANGFTVSSIFRIFFVAASIAYLPAYFDGAEYTPRGHQDLFSNFKLRDSLSVGRKLFPSASCFLKFDGEIPDPTKQYIVLLSPHGVLSMGHWFLNVCEFTPAFGPKRRSLAGDVVFKIPGYRELMCSGGLISADARTCEATLEEGYTVIVLPGGIIEQVGTKFGEQAVYIRRRRGIFKYALKYGIPLYPIYSMNEVVMAKTSSFLQGFRDYLAKAWWFPWFICSPYIDTTNMACYGGNPISMSMAGDEPTHDEITQLQELYIAELQRLYKKYRKECGHEQEEIIIR